MPKLGLIAGNRSFPIHVARAAKALGYEVIAVGLKEETDPSLEREVDAMHWVSFSEIGSVPRLLKQSGVQELILVGQIRPERLLQGEGKFDSVVQQLFKFLPDHSGASAMKMAVRYLESQGFRILHSGTFLKQWIPSAGVLTRRKPSEEERQDLAYGAKIARQLAGLGIGQTIVVRRKAVVAVEAMEGTDQTIRRAGAIAGSGCVVVKSCEMEHDMRFDIPVVGLETLRAMEEAQIACIGVEGGRVLLFNMPELIEKADQSDLTIAAL